MPLLALGCNTSQRKALLHVLALQMCLERRFIYSVIILESILNINKLIIIFFRRASFFSNDLVIICFGVTNTGHYSCKDVLIALLGMVTAFVLHLCKANNGTAR